MVEEKYEDEASVDYPVSTEQLNKSTKVELGDVTEKLTIYSLLNRVLRFSCSLGR